MNLPPRPDLTSRQMKFLMLCARPNGACPWLLPKYAPRLRQYEIDDMCERKLIEWRDGFAWHVLPAGREITGIIVQREAVLQYRRKRRLPA